MKVKKTKDGYTSKSGPDVTYRGKDAAKKAFAREYAIKKSEERRSKKKK